MDFKGIQKDVDEWTSQFDPQYWPPHEILARLSEETGEVAREINHLHGTKKKKASEDNQKGLEDELCDVLFTVCCMANSQGIDLQETWDKMMKEKHYGRDKDRFKKSN
jgi:NTP pyrophosphatase (non-canonical NTP hydrolase)